MYVMRYSESDFGIKCNNFTTLSRHYYVTAAGTDSIRPGYILSFLHFLLLLIKFAQLLTKSGFDKHMLLINI